MPGLIVYADGFNLYHGMKAKFGRRLLWLDLVALATRLRPKSQILAVKYYTASVLDDPAAASRQGRYQRALLANGRGKLEITQGRYQKKTMTCRSCGTSWLHYEERPTSTSRLQSLPMPTGVPRRPVPRHDVAERAAGSCAA